MSLKRFFEDKKGFIFCWTIKHFSLCVLSKFFSFDSPVFRIHQLDQTEWKLNLEIRKSEGEFVFKINREEDHGLAEICIDIKLFVIQMDGYKILAEDENLSFEEGCYYHGDQSPTPYFGEVEHFILDDILTVGCFIRSENMFEFIECTACTEILIEKFSFEIPFHSSQPFKIDTLSKTSVSKKYPDFSINLQPSCTSNSTEFAVVKIEMAKSNFEVLAKGKLSVQDASNETVFLFEGGYKFESNKDNQSWNLTNSVTSDGEESNLTENSNCFLHCELVVSNGRYVTYFDNLAFSYPAFLSKVQYFPVIPTKHMLTEKLKRLHADSRLCDFTLRVGGEDIQIHKAVLGAVSPVFCAMFEQEMKEKKNSVSIIEDIDKNTVKRLIDFVYSESVEDLQWDSALKLYNGADKYQIMELRQYCANWLIANLTIDNVTDVLTISDMHQDNNFEKAAVDFVFAHAKEVFRSENWKTFLGTDITCANKIMQEICIKFTSNHFS